MADSTSSSEPKETETTIKITEETKEKTEITVGSEAGTSEDVTTEPKKDVDPLILLSQGKRNMVCGEIPQAVNNLQEACRLLAEKHGETADECGEAYLAYGTALLDLARMESGVLGNALQGVPEEVLEDETSADKDEAKVETTEDAKADTADEEDNKEGEDISDQVIDAMTEDRDEKAKEDKKEEKGTEDAKETETDKETVETEAKPEQKDEGEGTGDEFWNKYTSEGDTAEEEDGEEEEEMEDETEGEKKEEEEKDEEDVTNLQLAWEVLELAKVIYGRQESKEMKLKAAESHLKLGEVGLETEQYEQSIEDFKKCLEIQKSVLEPENRLLGETHYQLGLAYSFNALYDKSICSFKDAVSIIESKIAHLKKFLEENDTGKGKEPAEDSDPITAAHKEIKDLLDILPDMQAKIEDAEEEKKNAAELKKLVKDSVASDVCSGTSGFGQSGASSSAEVTDITHLVRKKRKPDDGEESDAKKSRQEETTAPSGDSSSNKVTEPSAPVLNGSGDATNGHSNGHASSTKDEIKTKTVEDVLKQQETMETTA